MAKFNVPIWEKACMTIDEAAAYSNIGTERIRELTKDKDCNFALKIGTKTLVKRKQFTDYIDRVNVL